jgi:hypothetical protein
MDPDPVHKSIREGEGGRCPKSYNRKEANYSLFYCSMINCVCSGRHADYVYMLVNSGLASVNL